MQKVHNPDGQDMQKLHICIAGMQKKPSRNAGRLVWKGILIFQVRTDA